MRQRRTSEVARRRVFYIPGYDPNPPRRYRELYRAEGKEQARISGYDIAVKPLPGQTGWKVRTRIDGQETQARVDVLVWHDLVKSSMSASLPSTYALMAKTAWIYLSTGTLRRLSWLAKGPVITALYPVAMLLFQLLAALICAAIISSLGAWAALSSASSLGALFGRPNAAEGALGIIVAGAVFWGLFLPLTIGALRWFKSLDHKTFVHYLMHDYAFTASKRGAYPAEIEARLHEFRHRIEAALREDVDEVLVVGHSSGAQMAVSIVADIVRLGRVPQAGPALAVLTLGQVIPMVSFLPAARRLRRDLAKLSEAQEITWVDVSAPGDGCCFALTDPVAVSGVSPGKSQQWPLIISAAFSQTLSREKLKSLRRRYFRLHFQYLCAFDRPGDYDYFKITAGPLTLGARFRGRRTSPSRIDVVASRFISTVT
jgi:hypothetical protein